MKKILFLMILLCSVLSISAQTETHNVYCELIGTQKFLSAKCNVQIDFGQNPYENSNLVDEKGKKLTFNSMVDAMNYMGKLGWKFESAYVVTVSNQNVYHWLLSKQISNGEQISDGFKTKEMFKEEHKE